MLECTCLLPIPNTAFVIYNQTALQGVRMHHTHTHTQPFSLIPLSALRVCYTHFFKADLMDNTLNHSGLACREDVGASLLLAAQVRR